MNKLGSPSNVNLDFSGQSIAAGSFVPYERHFCDMCCHHFMRVVGLGARNCAPCLQREEARMERNAKIDATFSKQEALQTPQAVRQRDWYKRNRERMLQRQRDAYKRRAAQALTMKEAT